MWLKIFNSERKKEKLGEVSGDLFESIIDKLEKEWFDLVSIHFICFHRQTISFLLFID